MTKQARGFALLSADRRNEIARMGGRAAHANGKGHEFTSEEARAAGRKSRANRKPGKTAAQHLIGD